MSPKNGTLYSNADNVRAHKILIAAKYSGTKIDMAPGFTIGESNRTADYLSKFPSGNVPAFQSSEGHCFFESNAIAHYVANDDLRGKTEAETAFVCQWTDFADHEIMPSLAAWVFDCLGLRKENAKELEKTKQAVSHSLALLDDYLRLRTYLVGERVTLADICCYTVLALGFKHTYDEEFRKRFVNVCRWFNTCVNQPEAKAVLGEIAFHGCAGAAAKKDKPVAQPAKPKAEKPAAEDDEEEGERKVPESDPFGVLPPGTFKMDDWKRCYSNNDFTTVALPYFWQNFDKANYSMWKCQYKFPAELTQVFMTCNLVTGMYQRLDRMRKHSFGVMAVFGVKNDNTIAGFFCWRGQDLAFKLSEDLQVDYESYDWTKVDPDSEEAKQAVVDYFGRRDGTEFAGKKLNQYFVWK